LAFQVEVTAHAQGDLAQLPPKQRFQVLKKVQMLKESPFPEGKAIRRLRARLKSSEPIYRLRVGDYRVIYLIREERVLILTVVHRRDLERALKELIAKGQRGGD